MFAALTLLTHEHSVSVYLFRSLVLFMSFESFNIQILYVFLLLHTT